MADKTGIQWTATVNPDGSVTPGSTWNPVTGCDKVSPGCAHCYAETVADRFWASQYAPVEFVQYDPTICANVTEQRNRKFTDVQCHEDRLDQPLRWRRPRRVFVNSMSDLFHEDVSYDFIVRVFAIMQQAHRHTFQVLTKRAARMLEIVGHPSFHSNVSGCAGIAPIPWPLKNVWLGVSVENQHFFYERVPLLLKTPAAIRFISYEPALGPLDLRMGGMSLPEYSPHNPLPQPDWVIIGGESGRGARPFDIAWARSVITQCGAAGVAVFMKQLGSNPYDSLQPNGVFSRNGKWDDPGDWPESLNLRQFPTA